MLDSLRRASRRKTLWNRPISAMGIALLWILHDATSLAAGPAQPIDSHSDPAPYSLIVRYKSSGEHALEGCAEAIFTKRDFFAVSTRDRSLSLDVWHQKHRVRNVRALFRRSDGTSFRRQSRRLRERLALRASGAPDLGHVYRIELADAAAAGSALAELRRDPHVEFAQLDSIVQSDFAPNDPFLTSSGSWGQSFSDLWGLERIGALEAWQRSLGDGQVVAVVDSGVDYRHPDLAANVWVNPGEDLNGNGRVDPSDRNGIDDDENGFIDDLRGYDFVGFGELDEDGLEGVGDPDPFDEFGHGTHVAGTIAAVANNGIGIAGVAPFAKIMAIRGLDESGRGRSSQLWRGVLYAIENGASVINASWSCAPSCPNNPLAEEVLGFAREAGVVFVTSAGNRSFDVIRNSPEKTDLAITVGSIGFDDRVSFFSNRGWLIDLVAPGGGPQQRSPPLAGRLNILSLAASSIEEAQAPLIIDELYYRLAGTSMSAPHVAGAVALLRSHRPDLDQADVRRMLRITSRNLGAVGHDPIYGAGSLDLVALLETEPPDLDLRIASPAPGEVLNPNAGPIRIAVRAEGSALQSYELSVSKGIDAADFVEIARGVVTDASRKIEWDAANEPTGPRVLRLRAVLQDGRSVDEYAVIALERVQPFLLSDGETRALTPEISGRRVVWQAFPRDRDVSEIQTGGFARGDVNESRPVSSVSPSELDQSGPKIDGRRIAWVELDSENDDYSVRGCVQRGRGADACRSRLFGSNDERLDPIGLGGGRVLWNQNNNFRFEVLGCLWKGSRRLSECQAQPIDGDTTNSSLRLLDFDGRSALLGPFPFGRIDVCTPVLGESACANRPLLVAGFPLFARQVSVDGARLVFQLDFAGTLTLYHCVFDAPTAACSDPRPLDLGDATGSDPIVSGNRIVWIESRTGELPAVAYCEIDDVTRDCNPVRLTGTPTPTAHARIDGRRIVWQDERIGPSQVYGLELPEIKIAPRLRARAGRTTAHRFSVFSGNDETLDVSLEGVSGPTPTEWNAELIRHGRFGMQLRMRPPANAGEQSIAIWQAVGRTSSGLETRRRIEVGIR